MPPHGTIRDAPCCVISPFGSRSVAKALTRVGRPVHFTTVARWKKREWQVEPRLEHPLAAVMRKVDLFVPLLTGDPKTKAADIMAGIEARATDRESMTEDQDWPPIMGNLLRMVLALGLRCT
jgi:hypothetical protein